MEITVIDVAIIHKHDRCTGYFIASPCTVAAFQPPLTFTRIMSIMRPYSSPDTPAFSNTVRIPFVNTVLFTHRPVLPRHTVLKIRCVGDNGYVTARHTSIPDPTSCTLIPCMICALGEYRFSASRFDVRLIARVSLHSQDIYRSPDTSPLFQQYDLTHSRSFAPSTARHT